jgi:hypothetical protein
MAQQKPKDDAGQAEVQKKFDEANDKGHFGHKPDGPANKEYSLLTGPDSPGAFDLQKGA